jgi:hypothetical protein
MPLVGPEALPCRYAYALKLTGASLAPHS